MSIHITAETGDLTTEQAAAMCGVSCTTVRKYLTPSRQTISYAPRRRWIKNLYSRADVLKLRSQLAPIAERNARKRKRDEVRNEFLRLVTGITDAAKAYWRPFFELARAGTEIHRAVELAVRYPTPESALADACDAMWRLNRSVKGSQRIHAPAIYRTKNIFIRFLVESGYLVARGEHVLPDQECYACEGGWGPDGYGAGVAKLECSRCGGIGLWRPACTYAVLRFVVGGVTYTWHQPVNSIDYPLPDVPPFKDETEWDPSRCPGASVSDVENELALVRFAVGLASAAESVTHKT